MDISRVVLFVVPMLVLLWIIYTGYKLVTDTQSYATELEAKDTRYVFVIGALTIVFGLFSFILGLNLVAELALVSSTWIEVNTKAANIQAFYIVTEEQKKMRRILVRTSVTAISVTMLIWTSYYGYTLASEPRKEGKLKRLSFLIGIIAIAFGVTNFSIGIAILADSAMILPAHLQDKLWEANVHENNKINAKLQV